MICASCAPAIAWASPASSTPPKRRSRGTRGRVVQELDGTVLERTDALRGRDVTLTIDMELQDYVLGLLTKVLENTQPEAVLESPAGGEAAAGREARNAGGGGGSGNGRDHARSVGPRQLPSLQL